MKFILNWLFGKSVDSVLASFNKSLAQLQEVEQREQTKIAKHDAKIEAVLMKRNASSAEAARAASTAQRFSRLINGDEPKTAAASVTVGSDGYISGFGMVAGRNDGIQ